MNGTSKAQMRQLILPLRSVVSMVRVRDLKRWQKRIVGGLIRSLPPDKLGYPVEVSNKFFPPEVKLC